MKIVIWVLVAILIVLHQDFWYWDDAKLVFGFMPIGLFYHACISLAAGLIWGLATIYAWPKVLEEAETTPSQTIDNGGNA